MTKIVVIAYSSSLGDVAEASEKINNSNGHILEIDMIAAHKIQENLIPDAHILELFNQASVVLFDSHSTPERAVELLKQGLIETECKNTAFIPVFGNGMGSLSLLRMGDFKPTSENRENSEQLTPEAKIHADNFAKCLTYWNQGGAENFANLFRFVANKYAGLELEFAEPIIYPNAGFMDINTGKRYPNYSDYISAHPLNPYLPSVAVIFYAGTSLSASLLGGAELFSELTKHSNLIPFFVNGATVIDAISTHFIHQEKCICDAIVSLLLFRLEGGGTKGSDTQKTISLLKKFNVPYYVAASSSSREISAWKATSEGLATIDTIIRVTLPEMDGAIDPVFLYAVGENQVITPVPGRGKRLAERILKRIALQNKPNQDKKIALVIYNYPPSEGTLGSASFLDVFASVESILQELEKAGYSVTPPEVGTLKDMFLSRGQLHNGDFTSIQLTAQYAFHVTTEIYLKWYKKLPEKLRDACENIFGFPLGNLMVQARDILIAGIQFGNVVVVVQPSRGLHEDPAKLQHDDSLPAHHQYIAFYRWLEEQDGFGADAVVHVGTHGTFEFLPAKQVALSADCTPDALLGSLPHTYIYHVSNVSEGTGAKRRSYAQLVSYASPAFTPAELYEYLEDLEDLLDEYESQQLAPFPRRLRILRQIVELCNEHNVSLDLTEDLREKLTSTIEGEELELEFYNEALEKLHIDLFELKRVAIPIGLHTFGEMLDAEGLIDYLALVARYDRGEISALPRLLAESRGWNYDKLLDDGDTRWGEIYQESRVMISQLVEGKVTNRAVNNEIIKTLAYLENVAADVKSSDEVKGLLLGLSGRYVEPGCGGDLVRNPATYPTGRNTFQFDPTKVPTVSAYERGASIAEETIRRYYQENHSYPDAVGVILWGLETCKTYGETVGQVLRYIGIDVERKGFFMQPVVIPLGELGRPRIDVTVNISGFFRDLFPNLVQLIDLALRMVAALDEPLSMNHVRRHTLALLPEIGDKQLASARLFGPPLGEYGNGLSALIQTSEWQEESDFGNFYIKRTQYVYGKDISGEKAPDAFKAALKNTKFITQVRDSHEHEIIDIDHYYEFFGGMAQAAKIVSGNFPDVFIADTTTERIQVKTLQESVKFGVISRLLNPKWIDGLLQHPHQGGQDIADRVENLLGLDATTQSVGTATWSQVAQRFIFDTEMLEKMKANNPYAVAEIIQRLGEASQRGYWQATESEKQKLAAVYAELDAEIEHNQILS